MSYHIEIEPPARKAMRKLDPGVLRRVDEAIRALAGDPRPFGYAKMEG